MTETQYAGTIDWGEYWDGADEAVREDTGPSADLVAEPFVEFLDANFRDGPDAYADVGCGPGDLAFEVAERYPDTTVVGYDAAEAVLAANRERAREADREVAFERAVLPEFDPDRRFDVVSCLFTLCYVADIARAIERLYGAVEPGGCLVFNYHNRLARAHYNRIAEAPHEHLGEDAVWDPERFTDRFELVLAGENLLSYERIHEVLGTWPQSVFSLADDAEPYAAHRYEPLVYVPK
ncbi:class I SAM-dependent methyltransferase [Halorubrum ezzemoulense]|uniref:Type 11 methyltransferase n=1 Tax=Halorubrum ezzemoulense TaxID=337243 RepID=A0A256JAH7_HALEZ|nr:class I SAM-dependent methyltransferase [Halorubrum ezzemoulense]MDB9250590.1 class I SAM-dependent methyltransferase [Halorubrum ezzemoulense]MDB9260705.1 class I SAM-dependent methyltransferase [Halorubrum ezzemoulense]MDB9264094.1 class I SAM-dependent methyltransferase [Halorubrum ezzemoulense]MDB9267638.1 class I SAM-dependent methyltransferase [Halorubrum ezzemoulense]MDB9271066.1 class I SAM-dependent methyltransferase [Halorubrum ezzemoulense]